MDLRETLKSVTEALESAAEYFDDRSDVNDGTDGQPVPNREMRRHAECAAALDKLPALLAALDELDAIKAKSERVWQAAAHLHAIVATDNYGFATDFVCDLCEKDGHDPDSTCPASPEWLGNIRDGIAEPPGFLDAKEGADADA